MFHLTTPSNKDSPPLDSIIFKIMKSLHHLERDNFELCVYMHAHDSNF